jgi:predicted TPR repeat methyltransferase
MVERAAAKADGRATLQVSDMRTLPPLGTFDVVTCLDDAVNYLLAPGELTDALGAMGRNLATDGVLVFDTNTLASYRGFFARMSVVQADDRVIVWDGRTPERLPAGGLASARIETLNRAGDGWWERTVHEHAQRHHPEAEVRAAIAAAGLELAGVWGMQLDGSLCQGFSELANSKALYVARRRA